MTPVQKFQGAITPEGPGIPLNPSLDPRDSIFSFAAAGPAIPETNLGLEGLWAWAAVIVVLAAAGALAAWLTRKTNRNLRAQQESSMNELARSRQRERWFATLFETAPDPMAVLDPAGRFVYLNQAATEITRYEKHELLGRPFAETDLLTPASLVTALSAFAEVLQGQTIPLVELRVIRKDRTQVTLEANPRLLTESGQVHGVLVALRDISHRKSTEERLRKSEARLVLAQRIGQVGSWEMRLDNDQLEWSAETYRIFGCDARDFVPTREAFHRMVHPGDCDRLRETAARAFAEGRPYDMEHRILRKDGTVRVVHERAEPIKDAQGKPFQYVGTVQDITEHKRLESQLRHSQKMEAVGQLAGGIAHEFNNIMTIIQGYTQVILEHPKLDPALGSRLREVALAAERAIHLTRQLLAFGRKQIMQLRPLDLNETIGKLGQMLQQVLGEDVALQLSLAPNLPAVHADQSMVELILLNLTVNARDAMPRGGCLRVRTSLVNLGRKEVEAYAEARPGRFVQLSVSDTGRGMDTETLSRIFEPFYTTKEFGSSSGLGLASVYGIVKQHQGWIRAFSQPGRGATFEVFLPVETLTAKPDRHESAGVPLHSGGGETILLVEDEPSLRELVRVVLKSQGYQIIEASSGPEAIKVYEQYAGKIHLLLTDMVMPGGLNGHDVAVRLKEHTPELKVLYTSGYSLDLVGSDLSLQSGVNFIPKPYTATGLTQAVRDCLDR